MSVLWPTACVAWCAWSSCDPWNRSDCDQLPNTILFCCVDSITTLFLQSIVIGSGQEPLLAANTEIDMLVPAVCILSELLTLSLALPTDLENEVTGFFLELLFDPVFKLEFAMVFFRYYREMQVALLRQPK